MGRGSFRGSGRRGVLALGGAATLALWLTACGVGPSGVEGSAAGGDTMPGTVETLGGTTVKPPIDQDVPAAFETATFALG